MKKILHSLVIGAVIIAIIYAIYYFSQEASNASESQMIASRKDSGGQSGYVVTIKHTYVGDRNVNGGIVLGTYITQNATEYIFGPLFSQSTHPMTGIDPSGNKIPSTTSSGQFSVKKSDARLSDNIEGLKIFGVSDQSYAAQPAL